MGASPLVIQQINAELQKRGLTEAEVKTRLLQKGINIETIPPTELPKYKAEVLTTMDELMAEKKRPNTMHRLIISNLQCH
jgi:hypothetical protein